MMTAPHRDWLREKEVLDWQPWMTRYLLEKLVRDGELHLKTGGTPEECDVWQRRPKSPKFYRTATIQKICCGTNGVA